ncbi:MAG: TolC family protein [Deltaproteobacteria bacterium]|nr:TolC family protein [Deltaproteobacteria bacterium]
MSARPPRARVILAGVSALALGAIACHSAAPALPRGEARARWLAERAPRLASEAAAPAGCPEDEDALVALASERGLAVLARRAEGRAKRLAAEVPDARPLGLRLTNVRVDEGFADRAEAAVRFRPERPGTIAAERDVIRREADALAAEALDEARIARAEVRMSLAKARASEALAAIAEREIAVARAIVASARSAAGAGAMRELELTELELELGDVEAERARRIAERDLALTDALARAGVDVRCRVALGTGPPAGTDADGAALADEALARHPLVDARWAAEQGAVAERHLAVAQTWPWLDFVQVGIERRADPQGDETHVVVGLELELPIFVWGGEATEAADARLEAERTITRATLRAITDEVAAARAGLAAARARLAAVPAGPAGDRIEAMRRASGHGDADLRELARLERDAHRLERERIEARRLVEEAAIRLDAALGR